jgi:hypothetical protein
MKLSDLFSPLIFFVCLVNLNYEAYRAPNIGFTYFKIILKHSGGTSENYEDLIIGILGEIGIEYHPNCQTDSKKLSPLQMPPIVQILNNFPASCHTRLTTVLT